MLPQLQKAMLEHFRTLISTALPIITPEKVFLTVTDDIDTHKLQLEELLADAGKQGAPILPYACLIRGDTSEQATYAKPRRKQRMARDVVVHSESSNSVVTVDAVPFEFAYRLRIYAQSLDTLDSFYVLWMLSEFDDEQFYYTVNGIKESIPVTLGFDSPTGTYPTRSERRETGPIFYQEYPILVSTVLISKPMVQKVILKTVHSYYDGNFSDPDSETVFMEKGKDVVPIIDPPTSLTASVVSGPGNSLAWQHVDPAVSFIIERAESTNDFERLVVIPAGTLQYTDTGITSWVPYRYRVQAILGTEKSLYSNEVALVVPSGTA